MMKKVFSVFAAMLVILACSVCFAEIPSSEVALGGIKLGASPEYVKSIYGEPTSYDKGNGDSIIYNYNNTFKIMFSGGKYMYWMETTANNGIKTPSGIAVGMNASVLDRYGEVYYDEVENGVRNKAFWAQGRIVLIFGIVNNKIVSIKAAC
jgi:hypothetical protein